VTGAECFCGERIRQVRLPHDIAAVSGRKFIWVHAGTGDTKCYPESGEAAAALAAPADATGSARERGDG
jgi:hypothetical protein